MTSSVSEALEKLQVVNDDESGSFSIFIYYVNRDLLPNDGTNPVYGVLIPCGQYNTKKKAEAARSRISAETGAHSIVLVPNNMPAGLYANPTSDTIVYQRNEKDSVEAIEKSISEARRRKIEVEKRLKKEVSEREDPNSMSYVINKIYRLVTAESRKEQYEKLVAECADAMKDNLSLIEEHFKNNPSHIDTWQAEVDKRLSERGEHHLKDLIIQGMKDYMGNLSNASVVETHHSVM